MADEETKLAISQMTTVLLMDKAHQSLDFSNSRVISPEEFERIESARGIIREVCDAVAIRAGMKKI